MGLVNPVEAGAGLSLAPFRALRPRADGPALGRLLCPPYDVIDSATRERLLADDPDNAVAVVLPDPTPAGYAEAAQRLDTQVRNGTMQVDADPALYVYEMADATSVTRGLMGAVELRAPEDGVILPHENTMAGPVADRLAVMTATGTDLEPIYLIYDGGGAASQVLAEVDPERPLAATRTPDGLTHRLWAITDPARLQAVSTDLATRRALIADGHHRYATYRERQRLRRDSDGSGPWDRGLALVVDSTSYGPQVHAIHRVIPQFTLEAATAGLAGVAQVEALDIAPAEALRHAAQRAGFHLVLTDGTSTALVSERDGSLQAAAGRADEPPALSGLDVTIVHRAVIEDRWKVPDDVDHVQYAHSVDEAVSAALDQRGVALLLQPTPAAAVAAVAAAGARMPRKSTLFTPKPASGLVMRRLID